MSPRGPLRGWAARYAVSRLGAAPGPCRMFQELRTRLAFVRQLSQASVEPHLVRTRAKALSRVVKSVSILEEFNTERKGYGSRFVLREANPIRKWWGILVALLLLYTVTVFPYKLSFIDFKIPRPPQPSVAWDVVETFVDVCWWIDLGINFFQSFRDQEEAEVTSLPLIAKRYLYSNFLINLVACTPRPLERRVTALSFGEAPSAGRQAGGIGFAPLVRLARLVRLAKLIAFVTESSVWRKVQSMRSMRIVSFLAGLMGVVHLTACGLYLCAVFQSNQATTWVALRPVYGHGESRFLSEADSGEQWLHSLYIALSVFTGVGLDAFAINMGECFYTCAMMIVGAVVQSVVVSRIMNLVTNADQENTELNKKRELVARFAQHVQLEAKMSNELSRWISKTKSALEGYDQDEMRKILMFSLPESIMEKLHGVAFNGRLVKNRLISVCAKQTQRLPPRFPLLVALAVQMVKYQTGDMVYHWSDHPWNLFLVFDGTFAYIARPGPNGGICEVPAGPRRSDAVMESVVSEQASGWSHKTLPEVQQDLVQGGSTISPYLLFGSSNYFGEFEMFVDKTRVTSVRCEQSGTVLTISKVHFARLLDEFPDFGELWMSRALTREGHRKAALKRLKDCMQYLQLAVCTIQKHFRLRTPLHLRGQSLEVVVEAIIIDAHSGLLKVEGSPSPVSGRSPTPSKDPSEHDEAAAIGTDLLAIAEAADLLEEVDALRSEVRNGQALLLKLLDDTLEAVNRRRKELMQATTLGVTEALPLREAF